ncbi:MAG: hypothetical protein KDA61_06555 [Planctomycetales bacterium]|nr:hypothetical protein [Planctomycetales bacterium]
MRSVRFALVLSALSVCVGFAALETAQDKSSAPEQSKDDQALEKLLDDADLFYKKSYYEQGQRWEYKIAWSESGETSMLTVYLRSMGTRADGSTIWVVYAWTQAMSAGQGEDLSPAIIKLVAAINDTIVTGNVSVAGNGVYTNTGIVMQDLTARALSLTLWDLHHTRLRVRREIAALE